MGFSAAQYHAVVDRARSGVTQVSTRSRQIIPAATHATAHWYLPSGLKSAVMWAARKLTEISDWLITKAEDLLIGVFAPLEFFEAGWKWQTVRSEVSGVESSISPDVLGSRRWEGAAKDHYRAAIKLQSPAAGRIKSIAGSTANALFTCATAGLIFYAAIGGILFQFLGVLVNALGALLSGVLSLPAFIAIVGDGGITAAMIWGICAACAAFIGAQVQQMSSLRNDATDNAAFPGGKWPKSTT